MRDRDADLGLRASDLSEAERVARDEALLDDNARRAHEFGLQLFERMGNLPEAETATEPMDIRRRASRRLRWWGALPLGGLAAAAAALVYVGSADPPSVRDRGASTATATLWFEAAAKAPDGQIRPLGAASAARVRAGEQVIFSVVTDGPGQATLAEDGVVIHPTGDATWTVAAGRSSPGGDEILGFRTDAGPGAHRYTLTFCATGVDGCMERSLRLVWEDRP